MPRKPILTHKRTPAVIAEAKSRLAPKTVKLQSCWVWTGYVNRTGYGTVSFRGRQVLAHRLSYYAYKGSLPTGAVVRHSCDNPGCIRPAHLHTGSHAENSADMVDRGRQAFGSRNGMSKLTEADVLELKRRYAAGKGSQSALGAEFGVTQSAVSMIVSGQRWGYLEDGENHG